jgi:hypothetical protein
MILTNGSANITIYPYGDAGYSVNQDYSIATGSNTQAVYHHSTPSGFTSIAASYGVYGAGVGYFGMYAPDGQNQNIVIGSDGNVANVIFKRSIGYGPANLGGGTTLATLYSNGTFEATNLTTTGTITGNGSGLSNIAAANITGSVANATYALNSSVSNIANVAYSVAGSNVSGQVSSATTATTANTALAVAGANVTGTVANATFATSAGTVTTNAQPNITSVGSLANLTVIGTTNLGNVANITITGGSSGQVLTTNGSGGLSWATASGGSGSTKAGGIVNANVYVTLDNYKVRIPPSGNRSLQIATVSGTETLRATVTFVYSSASIGGSGAPTLSVSTTPAYFFPAHDFWNAGDGATYVWTNQTTIYRCTLQIGTSYTNNIILVERLL